VIEARDVDNIMPARRLYRRLDDEVLGGVESNQNRRRLQSWNVITSGCAPKAR